MNSNLRDEPLVQLPLCYLDWNIFDGFAKNKFPELRDKLFLARDRGIIHVPYSEWHLFEAVNVSNQVENHQRLVDRNLGAIREITDLVCVWEHDEPPGWRILRFPLDSVFDVPTTQKLVAISELFKPILAAFTVVKEKLLSFGLVPGTLNRFTPEEVILEINRILLKSENLETYKEYAPNGISFEEIVELTVKAMPDSTTDLGRLAGIYFLVDQIGYYSDKSVRNRVMSLWRDQMHVAWASRCQILISNDKRLRMKAQLTYLILKIRTVVLDPNSALVALDWMIENEEKLKAEYGASTN